MKKLVIILTLFVFALASYGQATPSRSVRIANRTTAFAVNLPAGTMIYCVSDSTNWSVKAAGVVSTRTINTAWAAAEIKFERTKVQNSATRGAVNYSIAIDSTRAEYQNLAIGAATTSFSGVMTAADKTKLDGISASSGTAFSETFEATIDSLTIGTFQGYYTFSLTQVPKDSLAFTVSLNGVELTHTATGQYRVKTPLLASQKILLFIPVYKYDLLSVTYTK